MFKQSSDPRPCAVAREQLRALLAGPESAPIPENLVAHLRACVGCREQMALQITLQRHAVSLAIPPSYAGGGPLRGDPDHVFILFDNSEGDPPRRLTIVVHDTGSNLVDVTITVEPPVPGAVLFTIGVRSFGARFGDDGKAVIRRIPAWVIIDHDAPDLEIALLPLTEHPGSGRR